MCNSVMSICHVIKDCRVILVTKMTLINPACIWPDVVTLEEFADSRSGFIYVLFPYQTFFLTLLYRQ